MKSRLKEQRKYVEMEVGVEMETSSENRQQLYNNKPHFGFACIRSQQANEPKIVVDRPESVVSGGAASQSGGVRGDESLD